MTMFVLKKAMLYCVFKNFSCINEEMKVNVFLRSLMIAMNV